MRKGIVDRNQAAPGDEDVARWLNERMTEKYG
jgi:hypothetical protein